MPEKLQTNPSKTTPAPGVLSLAELLQYSPSPSAALIEPSLLPASGILFVGGEPKVGKSILVANLALALASGSSRAGFEVAQARRVLICQFELPAAQFARRLAPMRSPIGAAADSNLFIDTAAAGHLLSAPRGLDHFLQAIRTVKADVIVLDPLYSTHDQDENDTRSMAALCQALLRLRDASQAALIVVHHVRKSVGRHEIGSAFRGSSALHAVGDSYLLLTRPAPQAPTIQLRFQFRYAAAVAPRLLTLDTDTLWFEPASGFRSCGFFPSPQGRYRRRSTRCSNFRSRPLQSTATTDHDSIGMLAPHRTTRYPARLSTGFHHQRQWPVSSAIVIWLCRGSRRGETCLQVMQAPRAEATDPNTAHSPQSKQCPRPYSRGGGILNAAGSVPSESLSGYLARTSARPFLPGTPL